MRTASEVRADSARYLRCEWLDGVEALQATFRDHRYPRHVHDSWTLALIERGAARFCLGREERVVIAGQIAVIPPGVVHTGEPLTPDGYRYAALYIHPERAPVSIGSGTAPSSRTVQPAAPATVAALLSLRRMLSRPTMSPQAESAAINALVTLAPLLAGDSPVNASARRRVVRRACELLNERVTYYTPLEELAAAVETSRYALLHAFRDELGITPHRYQLSLRIEHAKALLRNGEEPAAVAYDTGFCDQAHLTRVFRATLGTTPARYARAAH